MFSRPGFSKAALAGVAIAVVLALLTGLSFLPFLQQSLSAAPITPPSLIPTAQSDKFLNPLNIRGPDPWITYYDGHYYLAATTWESSSIGLTMRKAATIAELKES